MPLTEFQKRILKLIAKNRSLDSHIDLIELKKAWIEMSDEAEREMTALADEEPDMPIGVAFLDQRGKPGWFRDDHSLSIHPVTVRGCWPRIEGGA